MQSHAVSTSLPSWPPLAPQFGVDHSAGHPDHGEACGTGSYRASTGVDSNSTPSGSPGDQPGSDTLVGSFPFGVMPSWFGPVPNRDDQKPTSAPLVQFLGCVL